MEVIAMPNREIGKVALGLDVRVLREDGEEVELGDSGDYDRRTRALLEGDDNRAYEGDLESGGYSEVDESGDIIDSSFATEEEPDFDDYGDNDGMDE